MARFELTIRGGEKLLVETPETTSLRELMAILEVKPFVVFNEFKVGVGMREVMVATSGIMLLRPVADNAMQGSGFVGKR